MLLAAAAALLPVPAAAGLRACNRTSYILETATAIQRAGTVTTRGWTRLLPGACKTLLTADLSKIASFVYARSARAYNGPAKAWGGSQRLCARTTPFSLTTPAADPRCPGSLSLPFFHIPNRGRSDWTQTFGQTPPLASQAAAEAAGLIRLLHAAGLDAAQPAKALARLRARMHIPATAPATAVFDALESSALNRAAPDGYGICNDTDGPIFVALGDQERHRWHTRGWWPVRPGGCTQALATRLTGEVYLLVEGPHGHRLVVGKSRFCITNITFDVEGRGSCRARGLSSAAFRATNLAHHAGYTAHIGRNGLVPAATPG